MDGVTLTPLKKIYHPKGDILHAMKASDIGFCGFGEAYFSMINKGQIKGWKKHKKMVLNIVVATGAIQFVIYNEKNKLYFNAILSNKNHQRLTIDSGLCVAFRGITDENILLNMASIEHELSESENLDLHRIYYDWNTLV